MIYSMTGFGDASAEVEGVEYAVELRSLNNRYFKASIRMPESLNALEADLESQLRRRISRGSLVLTVSLRLKEALAVQQVDEQALLSYLSHLETVKQRIDDDRAHIDLTALLSMPGVLQPSTDEQKLLVNARKVLTGLVNQAVDRLNQMRRTEGQALTEDLRQQIEVIRQRAAEVAKRAPVVVQEYHQRLQDRVKDMLARAELKVDEVDLIKEVAIYADRADISEEIARTKTHLEHCEQILSREKDEPAGRSLDFLAQELLREANTIASKSNDAPISRAAVDIKSAIDRIKEQVQNVE